MNVIIGSIMLFFLPDYYQAINNGEPIDVCFNIAPVCAYEQIKKEHDQEAYAQMIENYKDEQRKADWEEKVKQLKLAKSL